MSAGMIALIVFGVIVVLAAAVAVMALPVFKNIQALADKKKAEQAQKSMPPAPLTPEQKLELEAFGDRLAKAISKGDGESLKLMLDTEGLGERVFDSRAEGFPEIREMKRGFMNGAAKHPGGWLRNIVGNKTKALHCRERDGFPAIVMRLTGEEGGDGGVNYVDIIAKPHGASFKAVDLFTYMYASYLSDEMRSLMATMVPPSGFGKLAALFGNTQFDQEMLGRLKTIGELFNAGKLDEVLRLCDALPDKYRTHRMFFMMRMQALTTLNGTADGKYDAAYRDVLRSAPDILGKDSTTDLLMIDLHFLNNELAEADACLQRVNEVVGGDPYLKVLRANTHRMMKDYEGALKLASEAQAEEPDLYTAVDSRLSIHVEQKHFAALVDELRAFKRSSGTVLDRAALSDDPQFKEFLASPEFAAWEKEIARP